MATNPQQPQQPAALPADVLNVMRGGIYEEPTTFAPNGAVVPANPKFVGAPHAWETPVLEEVPLHELNIGELDVFGTDEKLVDKVLNAQRAKEEPYDPFRDIPEGMKAKRQWVRWKLETVNGKSTKVPYQVNGVKASSTDSSTWTDYQTAVNNVINQWQGVGFMFAEGFAGIDLDGCRDPKTGELKPWAEEIVEMLQDTYIEVSPSRTGLHIFVLGKVPGIDKKFNLNPAIGHGKAAIEIYDSRRYFTVTGDSYYDIGGEVKAYDLTEVYAKFHELRKANPAPRNERADAADAANMGTENRGKSVQAEWHGFFRSSKYSILKNGEIIRDTHPFVIDDGYGRLQYDSPSEADFAFCTVTAFMYQSDPTVTNLEDKIWEEYTESSLARDKWLSREKDFRKLTIAKAIESAKSAQTKKTSESMTLVATTVAAAPPPEVQHPAQAQADAAADASKDATGTFPEGDEEEKIPSFDGSVITGVFNEVVDLMAGGTTIPRQFPFLFAKIYVGSRMAVSGMTFEGIEDDATVYGAVIGETGTSKGLSWKRGQKVLMPKFLTEPKVKVLHSVDSGAGLRDAFFDPPNELPIICNIEEIRSLGHKAGEKKNPEIWDTIIELANSHCFSRVKAKKSVKGKAGKTHDAAYLSIYMCGQNGKAFMSSAPDRTDMGLWDRFYPEYAEPVIPGDLPLIDDVAVSKFLVRLDALPFKGHMTMGEGVKNALDTFWDGLPNDVKVKVRFRGHLMLDMYFAAWSGGRMVATVSDLNVAIRIFLRQLAIRRVHFSVEVPDRVGYYLGLVKKVTEGMRKRLNNGVPAHVAAMTVRDFQTDTNAYKDNDLVAFNTAWRNWRDDHLVKAKVKARNGQTYDKWVPVPHEDEVWDLSGLVGLAGSE